VRKARKAKQRKKRTVRKDVAPISKRHKPEPTAPAVPAAPGPKVGTSWLAQTKGGIWSECVVEEVNQDKIQNVRVAFTHLKVRKRWMKHDNLRKLKPKCTKKILPGGGLVDPVLDPSPGEMEIVTPKKSTTSSRNGAAMYMGDLEITSPDVNELSFAFNRSVCMAEQSDREKDIRMAQESLITRDVKGRLSGRQQEQVKVQQFLETHLQNGTSHSLYICGSPGTGKTATLLQTWKKIQPIARASGVGECLIIRLNGFNMNNPQEVYVSLLSKVQGYQSKLNAAKACVQLKEIFMKPHRMKKRYIVFIDEIDGLLEKAQRVLYNLFDWPTQPKSNIILIGIANSMNLTDRFLPRLRQRNCAPDLLVFPPYKKQDLKDIISQRLKRFRTGERSEDPFPFFEPIAIERLTQKVASMTGDIRRCLELARTALDTLLESDEIEKVGFGEMHQVLESNFSSQATNIIKALPFHQQMLVTSAALLFVKKTEISFNQLNHFYEYISKEFRLPRVRSSGEFTDMLMNITSQGLLRKTELSRGKSKVAFDVASKFSLTTQQDDIKFGVESTLKELLIQGVQIPSKIMRM